MALTDDERKSLLLYADNLYEWTEKLKKPCRVIAALLTGVLPPNEIESLFESIGLQNSFAGQQLLNDYQELIEAAKAAEKEFSDTTGQTTDQFQTMKYRAFSLANFMKEASGKAGETNKPQGEDGQSKVNIPDYKALNLANRTIMIGTEIYHITSEKVWDFLKDLCSAHRDDRLVPMLEGATNNKNNVDRLRKKIGNENLHKLIILVNGGYKLNPEAKILEGGQIGIRKTHLSRNRK